MDTSISSTVKCEGNLTLPQNYSHFPRSQYFGLLFEINASIGKLMKDNCDANVCYYEGFFLYHHSKIAKIITAQKQSWLFPLSNKTSSRLKNDL